MYGDPPVPQTRFSSFCPSRGANTPNRTEGKRNSDWFQCSMARAFRNPHGAGTRPGDVLTWELIEHPDASRSQLPDGHDPRWIDSWNMGLARFAASTQIFTARRPATGPDSRTGAVRRLINPGRFEKVGKEQQRVRKTTAVGNCYRGRARR